MTAYGILLIVLVAAAVWTVLTYGLLLSAIGLGITSAVLAVVLYELGAPLAAVFELSVCAGLITVVFVSAISLTPRTTTSEKKALARKRLARFLPLPFLVLAAAWLLWGWLQGFALPFAEPPALAGEVREVLWNDRTADIIGQIAVVFTGVFAVVVLFKHLRRGEAPRP